MIRALRDANSTYEDKITFIHVDWDKYRRAPISKQFKVRRQATLVMLKVDGEVGRLVAATSEASIKALLDKAL